jgi:ribosomal protein L37AE/L43A
MNYDALKLAVENGLGKCCADKHNKRPDCPECGSADTGTEVSDEWYCYSCGHQWMKKPHYPRK